MQEMLEEEVKKAKVKEAAKKVREFVVEGQTTKIPHVYPHFELSIRSQSAPKQASLTSSQENPQRFKMQQEAIQTAPAHYSPAPARKPEPKEVSAKDNAFKKKKPAWALTSEQHEQENEAEVDELLAFMDHFDASQYAEDVQVRELMANLHQRVGELKKEDNWKENWEKRLKDRRKKKEEEYLKEKASKTVDDDMIPQNGDNASQLGVMGGSVGSRGEAKTVMSEKTQGTFHLTRIHQKYKREDGGSKPRQGGLEQERKFI